MKGMSSVNPDRMSLVNPDICILPYMKVKVALLSLTFCDPMVYTIHGILRVRILESPFPSQGDLPNPQIKPRFATLQVDSLPAESPDKSQNTGLGSLSLLQGNFSTQKSNQGLFHCRPTEPPGKSNRRALNPLM